MQTYLKKKSKAIQRAYASCPSKSLDEVEAWAREFNWKESEDLQELRQAFLKLSKQLFAFFLPLAYSSYMIEKYWGGVFRLLLHVGVVASWTLPHADELRISTR